MSNNTLHLDEEKNVVQEPRVLDVNPADLTEENIEIYDVAAEFLASIAKRDDAAALLAPWTDEEEKAVKRKLDLIVMPLLWLANLMSGTDKVLLGTAVTFGLKTDLKLVGQQYSWANSAIYFTCIAFVFPQSWIFQKFSIGRTIGVNVFFYGITTFGTSAVKNFTGLIICRLLLGAFEGAGHSATGMVISMWWKKSEQPWRTGIMFSTLSSVVNGLLSFALQFYTPGPIARWRLLFVLMGCFSVCVGIANFLCIPANPTKAWWLTDRQKVIAIRRTASNQTGIMNHKIKWDQIKEALLDVKTWLINVSLNIPNGGLIGFNSLIVQSLGYTVKEVTLLAIPTGVISWVSSLIFARLSTKTRKPVLCTIAAVLICLAGTIMLKQIPRSNKGGSLAALFIMYCYWAPYIIFGSSIIYANVSGTSKKVAVYGISYWGYCVGNLIGPQTFRATEAPLYKSAVLSMLIFYCLSIVFIALYGVLCWQANKKKEKQEAEWIASRADDGIAEEWKDLTDKQNPLFRYSY
ncbi:uncharacterized protein I206_103050 [Kwoniella pini CBS 10737]|uniref:Allantoate permease n=1 Tax=Kwoniella pini CBS 10737 TaxID=1296096 RepID=A0A1B9IAY5_9TREE|nr:uncharacterized protein I206_01946 [Kwoniella pini CBS 10737]OCF52653.1 hypothetical protein I206_01946 [Kwoniella pini CBS 10737]